MLTPRPIGAVRLVFLILSFFTFFPRHVAAQDERTVLVHPAPIYPEIARKFAVTGTVKVQVIIGPDGRIKQTKFIGGHPLLVAVVEDKLKSWRYAPASGDKTTVLEFNFHP